MVQAWDDGARLATAEGQQAEKEGCEGDEKPGGVSCYLLSVLFLRADDLFACRQQVILPKDYINERFLDLV